MTQIIPVQAFLNPLLILGESGPTQVGPGEVVIYK